MIEKTKTKKKDKKSGKTNDGLQNTLHRELKIEEHGPL